MRIVYFIILFTFVWNYAKNQGLTNSLNNEITTRAKLGGHNIGKITKPSQTGLTGLDFTVNSDGSVTVNGTSTAAWSFIMNNAMLLKAGSYTLSSGIGANPNLYVQITNENQSASIASTANSAEKTFTLNVDTIVVYRLFYQSGQTFNNVVVKPMIRLATDESANYEPYSMTNREMTPYVQAISNPNLLNNPWFTVNQRGQSSYSQANAYTVDRWMLRRTAATGTLSVTDDGVIISASDATTKAVFISQYFEENFVKSLNGKAITVSLLKSDGTILKGMIASFNYQTSQNFIYNNGIIVDYESYNSRYCFRIMNWTQSDITIRAVKLELGSVSTLSMDSAPNYQQELAKCQRYFVRFGSNESVPAYTYNLGMAYEVNSSSAYFNVMIPIPMRSTPLISYQGSWAIGSKVLNNITVNSMFNNIVKLVCTTSQTFTAGEIELLENKEAGINYIDFSAEI